jgi:hypothetical protein
MSVLKNLKTLRLVSIVIQIIFRELVGSLLKPRTRNKRYAAALPQITSTI